MPEAALSRAPWWLPAVSRVIRSLPAGRYRAMNLVASRRRGAFWAALPSDAGRLRFQCDLRDPLMREACLTGRYEPQETALLHALLVPGAAFVDVGANWGYFTLTAAHLVGASGRVVAIEADPRAGAALYANVSANALANVVIVEGAASDERGMLTFRPYGATSDGQTNFGVALARAPAAADGVTVRAQPLDDLLDEAGVPRVDLLKMDIEGAEGRAVRGLSRRLATGAIDRMIVELHPGYLREQGSSAAEVIGSVCAAGFQAWQIDHSPGMHRRAAGRGVDPRSFLEPVRDPDRLGAWPHLLFARAGLSALPDSRAR